MRANKIIWTAAAALCAGVVLFAVVQIILPMRDYRQAGDEYAALRQHAPAASGGGLAPEAAANALSALAALNPDCVGWLQIPGTAIDYPVLLGRDNGQYLHTTFMGQENPVGSIFMDCGVAAAFDARHVILYGHNVPDGSMFGGLYRFLDEAYRRENPTILITTAAGDTRTYTIFAARSSDVRDAAYQLDFPDDAAFEAFARGLGAPEEAGHLLTLSTCTSGGGRDERVLVHAVRA